MISDDYVVTLADLRRQNICFGFNSPTWEALKDYNITLRRLINGEITLGELKKIDNALMVEFIKGIENVK